MANKNPKSAKKTKPAGKKPATKAPPKSAAAKPKAQPASARPAAAPPARPQGSAPPAPAPSIRKPERSPMPAVMFYSKPVAMNREAHRKLKLRGVPSFAFAAKTHSVPLTGNEFAAAARQLPILFVPEAKLGFTPVALLGLRQNENLFVDAQGQWGGGAYIPAFIRRYPFVLIDKGSTDDFIVGIDESFPGFNTEEGDALFEEDGKEGVALKRAIGFLNAYQAEAKKTVEFIGHLQRLELLIPRVVQVTQKDGGKVTLNGFSVVDEARLAKLDDKDGATLLKTGYLGWIYMHLLSLNNIADLSAKLEQAKAG